MRKIRVQYIDDYFRSQHEMRGNANGNDLHYGHVTKIDFTGRIDGKRHYGIFVAVFNPIIGSKQWINIKYFERQHEY